MLGAFAALLSVQHDQRGVEILEHDFGRVAIRARFFVLPLTGLDLALQIDLASFLEILLGNLCQTFVEDYDAVPLGLFASLAG